MSDPQSQQYQPRSPGALPESIPVTTALDFPEWRIERYVGSCFGLVVRSMGAVKGIGAAFKSLAGGEVTQYTELLEDSRRHAMDRMIENARIMGGNAVIAMRFDSSGIIAEASQDRRLRHRGHRRTAVIGLVWLGLLALVALVAVVGWLNLRRHGQNGHP